jgi:hypothetical protein
VLPDEAALTTEYSFGGDSSPRAIHSLQRDLLDDLPSRKAIDEMLKVFFDPSGPAGPSLCKSTHTTCLWLISNCPGQSFVISRLSLDRYLDITTSCISASRNTNSN